MAADLSFLARQGWGVGVPIVSWGYGGSGHDEVGAPGLAVLFDLGLFDARAFDMTDEASLFDEVTHHAELLDQCAAAAVEDKATCAAEAWDELVYAAELDEEMRNG